MKTAEEWIEQYQIGFVLKPSDIQRIQLDAIKEGMRRAAELCSANKKEVTEKLWELRAIKQEANLVSDTLNKAILSAAKKVSLD